MGRLTQNFKTRSDWRLLIIYGGTCDVNYKILFGNYVVFFHFLGPVTQNPSMTFGTCDRHPNFWPRGFPQKYLLLLTDLLRNFQHSKQKMEKEQIYFQKLHGAAIPFAAFVKTGFCFL